MIKNREISDYEIIKGCAEYLQISEAEIVSDDYMQDHPDVLDILVNVAINCKKKPRREPMVVHRQMVVHNLGCNDIGYTIRRKAELRTREKMIEDRTLQSLIEKIVNFINEKDYMNSDFEIINSKVVGYHGKKKDIVIPDGLQLGERAFSDSSTIESIMLNKEIKEIPWCAFSNCKKLTRIFGLEQVEKIGRNAFFGCERLSKVDLPLGITEIEDHAFYGCTSLRGLTFAMASELLGLNIVAFPISARAERIRKSSFARKLSGKFSNVRNSSALSTKILVQDLLVSPVWMELLKSDTLI